MSEEVQQAAPPDEEMGEYWERLPDGENHLRGVSACNGRDRPDSWHVTIWAQEHFRRDPLGLELRQRLQATLSAVPGVSDVDEKDNETWLVSGSPSGEALCQAAANVLDEFADRMRTAYDDEDDSLDDIESL